MIIDCTAIVVALTIARNLLHSEEFDLSDFAFSVADNAITVGLLVGAVLLLRSTLGKRF
jgi:hypothetical protein